MRTGLHVGWVLLATLMFADAVHGEADLYPQIVDQYLKGDWDSLETLLSQNVKGVAALPKEQAADVTYIKQALVEGHPAWWKQTKLGNKVLIHPTVWGRTLNITYDPQLAGTFQLNTMGAQLSMLINWTAADMENPTLVEHGYNKGELVNVGIWSLLETGAIYASLWPDRMMKLTEAEKRQLEKYVAFRGAVTAGYYGTPRARWWDIFLALDAYQGSHLTASGFIPRKPLGAMIVAEVVSHRERYPSLRLPARLPAEKVEERLAVALMPQFEKRLTFAEDRALRDAIKGFSGSNGMTVFTNGKVTLPSRLQMALDPEQDGELGAKREEWLREQLSGASSAPSTRPGANSRPASEPARGRGEP